MKKKLNKKKTHKHQEPSASKKNKIIVFFLFFMYILFINKFVNNMTQLKISKSKFIYGLDNKFDMSLKINSYVTGSLIKWELGLLVQTI